MATPHPSEKGQMLIISVLAMVGILGLASLVIDIGLAYEDKRSTQNGADAAALAGGDVLLEGGTEAQAVVAARKWASQNGYPSAKVTVNIPPTSGPYQGNPDYVEAIIIDQTQARFATVLGFNVFDIKSRAVAGITHKQEPYAIIVLNESVCEAFEIDGLVTITIHNAGTITNSDCPTSALYAEGGIILDSGVNDVVGGTTSQGPTTISPGPTRVGHITDPLATLPAPTPPSGPVLPCPTFSGPAATVVLLPGVYDCLIDVPGGWNLTTLPGDYLFTGGFVNDGSGGTTTFGAGVYTIRGDGWKSTGSGNIGGDGVMFYIDEGPLVMTGTGNVNITPPTSGIYKDIAFFQNRANTNTVYIAGESIGAGFGTIYALNAEVDFTGNAAVTMGFQIIADTFYAHGTSDLIIDYVVGAEPMVPRMKLFE